MSQGPIAHTGNPLDVAIDGNGFLVVQTPRGERYTRNGAMQINATGQLVTSEGDPVLGDSGPITFQPNDHQVSISRDGTISVREGTSNADSARGKLRLVTFANLQHLQKDGGSTFKRAQRRAAAAGAAGSRPRPGRDREIQRARRGRDGAHDRDHPRLYQCLGNAEAAEPISARRRSTSSPKFRLDEQELMRCARSIPRRPA